MIDEPRFATDAEAREAGQRVAEKHRKSLERLGQKSSDPSCHACGGPIEIGKPVAIYHEQCEANRTAEVEALQLRLMEESVKPDEAKLLDASNAGCATTVQLLTKILNTGEHAGTFGDAKLEALAQRLLKMRGDLARRGNG